MERGRASRASRADVRGMRRSYRISWLALTLCLASCGGVEETEVPEAPTVADAPEVSATPGVGATHGSPLDDEGFPSEWRGIRRAALDALEPCMGELEAGGPGAACVRYSELTVLFHQAEAFRLHECRNQDVIGTACREAPADPIRQSEYDIAVNPGPAPAGDGTGPAPEPSTDTAGPPDPVRGAVRS